MNLTPFKEDIERVGNQQIEEAIKKLEGYSNFKAFTDARSMQSILLTSKCNEVLATYLSNIDSKSLVPHPGLGKMVTLSEVITLYYYTVFPPLLTELTQRMADLYYQKFPENQTGEI